MPTCPVCRRALTPAEATAGLCPRCATVFEAVGELQTAAPGTIAEPLQTGNQTLQLEDSDAIAVDLSQMTREADLPEPMRTIAISEIESDADDSSQLTTPYHSEAGGTEFLESFPDSTVNAERTLGMAGEMPPIAAADATLVEHGDAGGTVALPDLDSPGEAERTLGLDGEELPPERKDGTVVESGVAPSSRRSDQSGVKGKGTISSRFQIRPRLLMHPSDGSSNQISSADYEIVRKLGEGGMGVVWLARQKSLNREVALKQIRFDKVKATSSRRLEISRQAFLTEAAITGDLNHPNIVPVYDLGSDADGNLLYSMKCVKGTSWDKLIDEMSEDENLEILRKVSDAIAFAHSRSVVHRDLKPSNIMVGNFGEVLVMDWGTALPLPEFPKCEGLLMSTGCAGTPAYMPPEQADSDSNRVGPHSDIYLLGAILYEIVTGLQPHPMYGSNNATLTTHALLQNARDNVIVPTNKTGELVDIARKAMQTRPQDRYRTVSEFIEALKNYQRHTESILIVRQARDDLQSAQATQDYATYARSLFGFENALKLWDANTDATAGLVEAKVAYANAALQKEDFDLGLTLVDDRTPVFQTTYRRLVEGQRERRRRAGRIKTLRWTAALLLFALFAGGSTAGLIIYDKNIKLGESLTAEQIAKQDAISQKEKAVAAEKVAVAAKEEAVASEKVAVAAKEEEAKAREKAEASAAAERLAKVAALREWYFAQIGLADQQVTQNAFDSARDVLKQIEDRLNLSDNRAALEREIGWEFQRLKYVCGLSQDELVAPGNERVALTAAAASPEMLATSNLRGEVLLWSTAAKQPMLVRTLHIKGRPNALAFTGDGQLIGVGDSRGRISLWDVATGESRVELSGHADEITRLLFLPDGRLVSGSRDRTVRIWNLADQSSLVLRGHPGAVLSIAHVAGENGKTIGLATGGNDRQLRYWDLRATDDGTAVSTTLGSDETSPVTSLAAQVRGELGDQLFVFVGDEEGNLQAARYSLKQIGQQLDAVRKRQIAQTTGAEFSTSLIRRPTDRHRAAVTQLLLDPQNPMRLISTSRDNTLRTWDIGSLVLAEQQKPLLVQVLRGHGNAIVDAGEWVDSAGGTRVVTASADGSARIWQPEQYAEVVSIGGDMLDRNRDAYGEILSISASTDPANRIMGVGRDGAASIWNSRRPGPPVRLTEGHRFLTQSAVFLKDSLVTVSFDGTASIWDTQTRAMVERWRDVGTTGVLAGSADGRYVITGYDPGKQVTNSPELVTENLLIWSLSDALAGRPLSEIRKAIAVGKKAKPKDVPDQPSALAVAPNGEWGIAGTENGYVQLIDLKTKSVSEPVSGHPKARNPDLAVPEGVTGAVCFSESEAATVGLDGWLHFWLIQDGKLVEHPTRKSLAHEADGVVHRVIGMAVSEDRRRIATLVRARPNTKGTTREERSKPNPAIPQIWICELGSNTAKFIQALQPLGTDLERVASVSLSPDGDRVLGSVVTGSSTDGRTKQTQLREWKLAGGATPMPTTVLAAPAGFEFLQAAYLPGDVDRVAVLSDAMTYVWRRADGSDQLKQLSASYGPIITMQACDLSRDGTLAVTASDDLSPAGDDADDSAMRRRLRGEIRIWQVGEETGQRIGRISLDEGAVNVVALCPTDPSLILVGGNQRSADRDEGFVAKLYRWDQSAQTVTPLETLGGHPQGIVCGRFSADGRRIITASSDGMVQVFDWNGEACTRRFRVPLGDEKRTLRLGELIAADLSDDGTLLVAADKNSAVVLDVDTGHDLLRETIQGHSSDWKDVRFATRTHENGPRRIWSASLDGTVKFWGLSAERQTAEQANEAPHFTVRQLLTLRGHQGGVLALAPLSDGGVATAGMDGRVILWPIRSASPAN